MTVEQPTYEEVSEMLKALLLDKDTDLAERYPETWKELQEQVAEIEEQGLVVDGYAL